jgi:hypothetical protein
MLDLRNQDRLNQIKVSYGLNESVSEDLLIGYFSCSDNYDLAVQSRFVEFVLNDALLVKYPPGLKYRQNFLKKCIGVLEKSGIEVEDSLYEIYIQLINSSNSGSNTERFFTLFFSKVTFF